MQFVRILKNRKNIKRIPAWASWSFSILLGSKTHSCMQTNSTCFRSFLLRFLSIDCIFSSTQDLKEFMASALFSFCMLFFMTFHSQDSRNDIYEECHYKLILPPFGKKNTHTHTKNTFSHKTRAGIKVWLIMYKCLLANLRPLLTTGTHSRIKSL